MNFMNFWKLFFGGGEGGCFLLQETPPGRYPQNHGHTLT